MIQRLSWLFGFSLVSKTQSNRKERKISLKSTNKPLDFPNLAC